MLIKFLIKSMNVLTRGPILCILPRYFNHKNRWILLWLKEKN